MLVDYTGTLILISHDRTFLNNVVGSTVVMEGDGIIETHQNTTCPKFYSAVFRLIKFISLSSF
jgi:ATPase subunit of ABC transporter with duplicated ATPase domains